MRYGFGRSALAPDGDERPAGKEQPVASTEQPENARASDPDVVEITRYPNRRLYDRSQGKYVTLQEIADAVRRGKTVSVRDSRTGEDLTRLLLTQIILEQYPERMELFPVAVLHSMIRANATVLESLRDYFRQSLSYLDVVQRSAGPNPFMAPLDWMRMFMPALSPPPPADRPDAEALARRVAELEQRLDQLVGSSGSKPPSRGKGKDRGQEMA
jgi:polyhydroxyalkanoate synthesis repressor PhaR